MLDVRVTDGAMLGALRRFGRARMDLITGVVMLGSVAVTAGGAIALARELPAWRGRLSVTRAARLIDDGDYTAAIRTLLGAVAVTPRDARAHYYLGLAYARLGVPRGALNQLGDAVRLAPGGSTTRSARPSGRWAMRGRRAASSRRRRASTRARRATTWTSPGSCSTREHRRRRWRGSSRRCASSRGQRRSACSSRRRSGAPVTWTAWPANTPRSGGWLRPARWASLPDRHSTKGASDETLDIRDHRADPRGVPVGQT